jgi:hypothetical protein
MGACFAGDEVVAGSGDVERYAAAVALREEFLVCMCSPLLRCGLFCDWSRCCRSRSGRRCNRQIQINHRQLMPIYHRKNRRQSPIPRRTRTNMRINLPNPLILPIRIIDRSRDRPRYLPSQRAIPDMTAAGAAEPFPRVERWVRVRGQLVFAGGGDEV